MTDVDRSVMTKTIPREVLVARLVRAGELELSGEDQEETDSYFDTEKFRFHAGVTELVGIFRGPT